MNEKIYREANNNSSLAVYLRCKELIEIYSKGETSDRIKQNAIVVKDGLEKIIKLKKQELEIDIQEDK